MVALILAEMFADDEPDRRKGDAEAAPEPPSAPRPPKRAR